MTAKVTTNHYCEVCGQVVSSRQKHDESNCESYKAGQETEKQRLLLYLQGLFKSYPSATLEQVLGLIEESKPS